MSEDWKKKAEAFEARNTLIAEVHFGRMTPGEAEEAAKTQGLMPLAEKPDPALFNPMDEPTWTLAMAVGWIVWRTPEAVRDNWDDYRLECWDWITLTRRLPVNDGKGFQETTVAELQQLSHATLMGLMAVEAFDHASEAEVRKLVSVKTAKEDLWRRLAEGALIATAVAEVSGKPVQVPAHEWSYLTALADKDLADELRYSQTAQTVEYREVTFRREDIIRLWPPIARRLDASAFPGIEFEDGQAVFTLLEATMWVGGEGKNLATETIDLDFVEEKGSTALFLALFKGQVTATGVNRATKLREPIPQEYWECATSNPNKASVGHYVSLVDRSGTDSRQNAGTLEPYGETEPRWVNIQIPGPELRKAFPGIGKDDDSIIASEKKKQTVHDIIRQAVEALWDGRVPASLVKKERDNQIMNWCRANDRRPPAERSLRNFFNS
ncbi:hypothetical protein [Hoeflea alexandrii]|uniref:Uncharacterized protein n=1 Tax=Hoeflea alexandrii TaxID=288436 RepID=A0ABT1CS71_9HYPH|nr:hypothetical protein [Hoeflea alexandrii]MCO6409052.1 hypothetical protein [Hoeflea alexandrii]MCY0151663.1 hypothetical protein [Hoeflea alexandrii]